MLGTFEAPPEHPPFAAEKRPFTLEDMQEEEVAGRILPHWRTRTAPMQRLLFTLEIRSVRFRPIARYSERFEPTNRRESVGIVGQKRTQQTAIGRKRTEQFLLPYAADISSWSQRKKRASGAESLPDARYSSCPTAACLQV